jgi:creatinine amidohydrolase
MSQVLDFKELTTDQVAAIDMQKCVVMIPGGLMEEHGPYLPLYTDGYTNEALTKRVADSLYKSTNFTILIFPTIPLGVGSPEAYAGKKSFPGVISLQPVTLRTLFMDIGDMLGMQGFQYIFIIFKHGSTLHNRALLQACDYFSNTYQGKMVPLSSIQYDSWKGQLPKLSHDELLENGIDIHAGLDETSRMLFNKPELVNASYKIASPYPIKGLDDLPKLTSSPEWKGYYGSPRLASKAFGEQIMNKFSHNLSELAIKIIHGFDYSKLPCTGSGPSNPADVEAERTVGALVDELTTKQKAWLKKNNLEK